MCHYGHLGGSSHTSHQLDVIILYILNHSFMQYKLIEMLEKMDNTTES